MIWFVVPFDRARFAENVEANWKRQHERPGLLVVQNGGARYAGRCDLLISVERKSIGDAMNAGVELLRQIAEPSDWVAKVDSDDDYGPEYAGDIARAAELGDWSGFPQHELELMDKRRGILGTPSARVCTGGTLAARLDIFEPMGDPRHADPEDQRWCVAMGKAGHRFVPRGPRGYLRRRYAGSSDPCSDGSFMVLVGLLDPTTGKRLEPTREDYDQVARAVF